jgi:predicted metalloprotease
MAKWDSITSRGTVDDRRGFGVIATGGVTVVGLVFIIGFTLLSGGSLNDVLLQLRNVQVNQSQSNNTSQFDGKDSYEVFASTVLGSTNDLWTNIFAAKNKTYVSPKLVLFRDSTESGCGTATSSVGPFYCPIDSNIYLDETFFDELTNYLGAQGGDVAQAYVIAHEVGHNVQNQLGTLDSIGTSNDESIKLELQADCYSGLWVNSIKNKNILETGEVNEALDAAAAVGDDRIQSKVEGQINPETWTHGSSEQRKFWFNKGYESGDFAQCDTF